MGHGKIAIGKKSATGCRDSESDWPRLALRGIEGDLGSIAVLLDYQKNQGVFSRLALQVIFTPVTRIAYSWKHDRNFMSHFMQGAWRTVPRSTKTIHDSTRGPGFPFLLFFFCRLFLFFVLSGHQTCQRIEVLPMRSPVGDGILVAQDLPGPMSAQSSLVDFSTDGSQREARLDRAAPQKKSTARRIEKRM